MSLSQDMTDQLNLDGTVEVENIIVTPRGTTVIFVRQIDRSAYGLSNKEEIRSAFFGTDGLCRYNMIIN